MWVLRSKSVLDEIEGENNVPDLGTWHPAQNDENIAVNLMTSSKGDRTRQVVCLCVLPCLICNDYHACFVFYFSQKAEECFFYNKIY